MSETAFVRWEQTHLVEAVYALRRGLARWQSLGTTITDRVKEKIVSGPDRPKAFELDIPLFRFLMYPGGKSVITPSSVAAAEARMADRGLLEAWEGHLNSRSPVVFGTERTGYLKRRVDKEVVEAAEILHRAVGVDRESALEPLLKNPYTMTFRVFSSELADEHVAALATAAADKTTVRFKGKAHRVEAVTGNFNVFTGRFDTNYDLIPSKTK